jgi:tetratricopeptide (TPR) repeat protein
VADEQPSNVVGLWAHHRYRPDPASLACRRVAAARQQTGLSRTEFAAALRQLLPWAPTPELISSWETDVPPPGDVVVACDLVAHQVAAAGTPVEAAGYSGVPGSVPSTQVPNGLLQVGTAAMPSSDAEEMLMSAASESSADVLLRSGHVGREVMPELIQQIMDVARSYNSESRLVAFHHARITRDLAVALTQLTKRPSELSDLYVAAGEANALMASLAFDLGKWTAAEPLARAATAYADIAGHRSLNAWALGLEATLAFWRGDGQRALDRVDAGLVVAPVGMPRVRLLHIAARAHAVRGDRGETASALAAALSEREVAETRTDELDDQIAGEFRFDDARAAACAGAAWLQLGSGSEAVSCTRRTLEIHKQDADAVGLGVLSGARIDAAAALLLQGDLDEAAHHLEAALTLDPDAENVSLGSRLTRVRRLLETPMWRNDTTAGRLADLVHAWLRVVPHPSYGG